MKRKWKAGMLLAAAIAVVITDIPKIPVKATGFTEINLSDASMIPDEALRAHLKETTYDKDRDGILSAEEIQNITSFVLQNCGTECKGISDFTGIEYLTELTEFNIASAGNVTSLDLSKNTKLTWVNVSSAAKLSSLTLGEQNNLVTLNASNCGNLSNLEMSAMNSLETIDVSGTPLTSLRLSSVSKLKTLTADNMTKLTSFSLSDALLTTLDLSGCPELTYVSINYCKNFKEIDLSGNTKLTSVYLTENAIQRLDVTNNTALTSLTCSDNQITSLDISKNSALKYLTCYKNQLTSLNVSQNVSLESLQCYDNQLTTLTLPDNGALNDLDCHNNQLEELNLSTCPGLQYLNADCNKLKTIDLSKNEKLQKVKVSCNQLATVDTVPSTTNLRTFYCYNNKITKLDLTENGSLCQFNASDNCLPALDLSNQTNVSTSDYFGYNSDIVKKQVYSVTPEEIEGSGYLLRIKKETNSAFDYKKVVEESISGINATLTEDGFVFDTLSDIPFKFTYQYETKLNGGSYPMTVTVINPNSSSTVRINYRNTSIFNWNNPNPWEYTMGDEPIALQPVEKEGAKFSKWVLWNYSGNPKDLPAVTELSDDVIIDALISTGKEYVTLRAVFEPDVVEIQYDREVKEDGSIDSINDSTFKSNNPSYVEFGKTIVLKDAAREGYTFEGWYTDPEFSEDSKVTEFCEEDEIYFTSRYLYAKWSKKTSTGDNGQTNTGDNGSKGDNGKPNMGDNGSAGGDGKPGTENDGSSGGNQNIAVPAQKGKKLPVKDKKCQVKVTSSDKANPTVSYVKTSDKNAKKITIPDTVTVDGVTYKVTGIADNAFKGNSKITRVTIGKNVTAVGKESFKKCKNLTTVTIGKNVKSIGKNAFYGCKKLKSVTVTAGNLKTIGKKAFTGIDKKVTFKVNGAKKAKTALKKKLKSKTIGYLKTWTIK